jgi:hypothetical protein
MHLAGHALCAALLLAAPARALALGAEEPAGALARFVINVLRGYNTSAIPPDFSQNVYFEPTQVPSSSPFINQVLDLVDAATQAQYEEIPGVCAAYCIAAMRFVAADEKR